MKRKSSREHAERLAEEHGTSRKRSRSVDSELSSSDELGTQDVEFTPTKRKVGRPASTSKNSSGKKYANDYEAGKAMGMAWAAKMRAEEADASQADTPAKRGRGRPKGSKTKPKSDTDKVSTPTKTTASAKAVKTLTTPQKGLSNGHGTSSSTLLRNPDRSARRKSARMLIERTMAGDLSEDDDEDEDLTRDIYDIDNLIDEVPEQENTAAASTHPDGATPTPVKRGRGRPKGVKNRRSPTPPGDLPPHEHYFYQNRGGGAKTSNNTLSAMLLPDHEEYFNLIRAYKDPHTEDLEFLQDLHARSFNQWQFELSQNFNICVYGWGSKRTLLTRFAEHIYAAQTDHVNHKIVVVNGYVHNTTIRDIFNTVAKAILGPDHTAKLGSQPTEMLETLASLLTEDSQQRITLVVHSIDAVPLRRAATQNLLARLSSHPQIHLLASADNPSFPLLWDSSLRSTYNFLFHDCTTFKPYGAEVDVVETVNELLGRSGRRVGGKEGVSFVLKSLPENAKNLFRVLVAEQLAAMDDSMEMGGFGAPDEDEADNGMQINGMRQEIGVEYRVLYQKAAEEFICSSEMAFRSLLKEFHDHQMIQSRKDALGTEMLSAPFRKEELETILEDLMS